MTPRSEIIQSICQLLSAGDTARATQQARESYAFAPQPRKLRTNDLAVSLRIFQRDGFVDRYTGEKLVFPGVLRLLSTVMPAEFPYHPNYKLAECHLMYWELMPTLDHVHPVARGGADAEENLVTTSMLRNAIKSHWTLAELGWELKPEGKLDQWDGLLSWFFTFTAQNPGHLQNAYVSRWHRTARKFHTDLK